MMRSPTRHAVMQLSCPECGREISLHATEGLPAGLSRLLAPCPDCDGHHLPTTASALFHQRHALPLGSIMMDSMAKEARG